MAHNRASAFDENGNPFPTSLCDASPSEAPAEGAQSQCLAQALAVTELEERSQREISAQCRGESTLDTASVELLRRATTQSDQEAWACFHRCLAEYVRGWLHHHPKSELAAALQTDEQYVVQTFVRFWQYTTGSEQREFRTLAPAMQYLYVCLNSVILDSIRVFLRPKYISLPQDETWWKTGEEASTEGHELWKVIQNLLPDRRERRMAYLLFHCGLEPGEIIQYSPEECSSIQDISRLRQKIFQHLLHRAGDRRLPLQEKETQEDVESADF